VASASSGSDGAVIVLGGKTGWDRKLATVVTDSFCLKIAALLFYN
jgi:hypothetical protein